jgi:purine-nucleoside/S-methyl-5'-thioadenosine phosphorylase / adenosine deaminase
VLRYEEDLGAARFALTDRVGGVSAEPFAELNLAIHVGDDPGAVEENRRRVAGRLGLPVERVVFMNQVHGGDVAVVEGPWPAGPAAVDALVTRSRGTALAVLVADCVPVLLADPRAAVVGVVHAGRMGLLANVVGSAVAAMRDLGARDIIARVGPSVCSRCYEVPEQLRASVTKAEPASWSTTRKGTPAVDVAAGVGAQLDRLGVDVQTLAGCTLEDTSLYSFRRDHTTGRFAGLAWLPPAGPG